MRKTPETLKCPDCNVSMKPVFRSKRVTWECVNEECIVINAHHDRSGRLHVYRMPLTTNYQGVGDV